MKNIDLQQALTLDRNIFIEASAGTGKTYTLTKRYCAILDDFARQALENPALPRKGPSNILVITFTRKAADEMAVKIYRDLKQLLAGRRIDPALPDIGKFLQRCPGDYQQWLEGTYARHAISTIDSFCMQILKDYALASGLDPDFKVEEEVRSEMFFEKQLDGFLREKAHNNDPVLAEIFQYLPASNVKKIIRYLYQHRLFLQEWLEEMTFKRLTLSVAALKEEIWSDWVKTYTPDFDEDAVLSELREWISCLENPVHDEEDAGRQCLRKLQERLYELPAHLSGADLRREICENILSLFMTVKGDFYKNFKGNNLKWCNPKVLKTLKERYNIFIESLGIDGSQVNGVPNSLDRMGLEALIQIHALFVDFQNRMTRFQKQMGYLTFDDIILQTQTLLREHESIRLALSRQFEHILVDEFQDTNDPRWDIIRSIASDDKGNLRPSGLFIVGDKKQSIYGFQQADVTVMNRASENLKTAPLPAKHIDLSLNFRSSERYIQGVINRVFPRLFTGREALWQPFFFPAEPGKVFPPLLQKYPENLILIRTVSDVPSMDRDVAAAINTARTAQEMLAWWDDKKMAEKLNHDGPVIGILLRSFTHVGAYASVFKRFNLPLEVIAGSSFFLRQEIFDFCHLLAFYANPHDDLALTSLARSPWLMMTDAEVDEFRERDTGEPVWTFIHRRKSFKALAETLDAWLERAANGFFPDVIEDILKENDRELACMSEPEGERTLANVDLAVHLLRGLMNNGMSLRESMTWFTSQRDRESKREEAGPGGTARICLMTVHKAKGLEFPMVILGDMTRKGGGSSGKFVAHAEQEGRTDVVINLRDEEDDTRSSGVLKSVIEEEKAREEAEELRIFYVAVTRAMFQVAFLGEFAGSGKKTGRNTPWYRYVTEGVLITEEGELPEDPLNPDWENTDFPSLGLSVRNDTWDDLKRTLPEKKIEEKTWYPPNTVYATGKPSYRLTPHDVMAFIGSRESPAKSDNTSSEENRQYGIFFHKVMEEKWWNAMDSAEEWLKDHWSDFPDLKPSGGMKRLAEDLERMKTNPLFDRICSPDPGKAFFELPVSAAWESEKERVNMRGVIDLLFREGDQWTILDYKTDHDLSALDQYKVQMNLYQEMLAQAFDIKAQGIIWYVRLNHAEEISENPAVTARLSPSGLPMAPVPEKGKADPELMQSLTEFLEDEPALILCVTKTEAEEIRKGLIYRKCARPDIHILSWQDLQRVLDVPGKGLDPGVRMLLCRQILKHNASWPSTPGTARKLSEAVSQFELFNVEPDETGHTLIQSVCRTIRENHLTTDGDILKWLAENHPFKGMDVFLTGWYQPSVSRHELMKTIAQDARRFRMPDSNKIPDTSAWKKAVNIMETSHKAIVCNRADDEIRLIFQEIAEMGSVDYQSLHIAVSNPSEYEPLIKRIAGEYGIPVSFSTRIPLMQTAPGRWFLNLISLIEQIHTAEWPLIADVFLDPFVHPDQALYKLDLHIRQNALDTLEEIRSFFEAKNSEYKDLFYEYVEPHIRAISSLKSISRCLDYLKKSTRMIRLFESSSGNNNSPGQKVLETIEGFINKVPSSLALIGVKKEEMKQEGLLLLKEWIGTEELPRQDIELGVPVTGFLDTINLTPVCLWLVGLNQSDFPVRLLRNPFLKEPPYNPWYMNLRMLNHWCRLKNVRFLATKNHADSSASEASALLEMFEKEHCTLQKSPFPGRRDHYRSYIFSKILSSSCSPVLKRHNALIPLKTDPEAVIRESAGPYHGKARPLIELPHIKSATRIEKLITCPMKYWLGEILCLQCADDNKESLENRDVGSFVHAVLCRFGRKKGFQRPEPEALKLMVKLIQEEFQNRQVNPEKDLWINQLFRFVIHGMNQDPPGGKLSDIIRKNQNILKDFSSLETFFEQQFTDNERNRHRQEELSYWPALRHLEFSDLVLTGTIDKIFVDHEKKQILISDYKTGDSYDIGDVLKGFNIQPLVYYLKVKQEFPDYQVVFVYETIPKNYKPYKMSKEIGDTGFDGLFIKVQPHHTLRIDDEEKEKGKTLLRRELIDWFVKALENIKQGTFPHTTPDRYQTVCRYCDFRYTCRKT